MDKIKDLMQNPEFRQSQIKKTTDVTLYVLTGIDPSTNTNK